MGQLTMEATSDIKSNILMASNFLKEQKRLISQQQKDLQEIKVAKNEKSEQLQHNKTELEVKGAERERLIHIVEQLTQNRLEKDVVLLRAEHHSKRFVRCIYQRNRQTLHQYLTDLVSVYEDGLSEDMKQDPVAFLLQLLQEKKMLKKDFKPYSVFLTKGFYEEKPVRIFVENNQVRVETEVFVTADGANRLRQKELKSFLTAANSI